MRLPRVSHLLLLALLVGLSFAQDAEDSTAPKRVLKKYRVRRPVIVDDQGNVVRAGPRLRRVRVKNPKTSESSSPAPHPTRGTPTTSTSTTLVSTSSSTSSSSSLSPSPQPQILRQRTLGRQNANVIPLERVASPPVEQQHQREVLHRVIPATAAPVQVQQQQNTFFQDQDQGIVAEPIRTVPLTYRQPTSQSNRDALLGNVRYKPSRGTGSAVNGYEEEKKVGTTRNYSKINEDGSFTFGYEADDGSFKEETRGVDCVVRGKYGYIDPEGVRREFEYVSGNPCDPNNPNPEEQADDEEEDSLAPSRPILRQRVRPSELSDNNVQQGLQQTFEERLPEDQLANFVRPAQRQRIRPNQGQIILRQRVRVTTAAPALASSDDEDEGSYVRRPFPSFQSVRQPPTVIQDVSQSLEDDSRRPSPSPSPSPAPFGRSLSGLFNFDQEVHRLAGVPSRPHNQPQPLYEQPFRQVVHQPSQPGRQVFGNSAFRQEQATASPPTSPSPSPTPYTSANGLSNNFGNGGRYRTELVFDPNSGQYTSVQVQNNPHTNQEFELTQKLRAFVTTPSPAPASSFTNTGVGAYTQIQQFGQPQIQYYHQSEPPQQGRAVGQDPSQINQYLARHAYQQPQPQQQPRIQHQPQHQPQPQQHYQPQQSRQATNLQFIPPHLRPDAHQTAEIQRQEVQELRFPSSQSSGLSANSAAASNGQIDAFLRALNISI